MDNKNLDDLVEAVFWTVIIWMIWMPVSIMLFLLIHGTLWAWFMYGIFIPLFFIGFEVVFTLVFAFFYVKNENTRK